MCRQVSPRLPVLFGPYLRTHGAVGGMDKWVPMLGQLVSCIQPLLAGVTHWVGSGVREEGIRSMKFALSRLHNLFFEIKVIVLMSPEGGAFRL